MKMKKSKNILQDIINNDSLNLFTMLSGYFLLVLIIYTFFKLLNFKNCLGIVQAISIITPIVIYLLYSLKKKKIKTISIILGSYFFLTIFLPFIYTKTYDLTVDGNSYHKTAIAFIKNGWNPFYESARDFQKNNNKVIKISKDTKLDLWIEHYPKATWILAATIYSMTGNIESGKCITMIFSIMLFLLSFNLLKNRINKKWAFIISLLVVLNPIVLAQLFTYYVDGLMGILFLIEILLLFLVDPKQKTNKLIWINLVTICTVFTNLKYTGLLCSGVIAATFYFYWLIRYRKDKEFFLIFKRITINFIITFITAIFLVGANSYIKNTLDHHNPLYPIIGKNKVDIITTMQPKSFKNKNMIEKFVISLFSKSENVTYGEKEPTIKYPFKLYKTEIDELYAADLRIGGFGPLFALITIITTPIFIYLVFKIIKKDKEISSYIILSLISIIVSSILVGENWWARYVPQLYLIPMGTIFLLVYIRKYNEKIKINKLATLISLIVIIANMSIFAYIKYREIKTFNEITEDIKIMKNTKNLNLKLGGFPDLYGYFYTLNDNGVKYTIKNNIKEENMKFKYSWRIVVEEK
ncbi:MAG: hypothetical protein HFJ11_06050 [Bacilli bacterium]|nr:hypothetical protein [Bacilli bacterium]